MADLVRIKYKPRELFIPYHNRKQRWACIVAHRRKGKTVATINDTVAKALYCTRLRPRYGYIAPFYSQAKTIAWDYLKDATEGLRSRKPMESELRVDLVNGAVIRLFGADNPDALRGLYFDGVVLDEPAQMHPRIWTEVVRPALSDRKGWATFIGTPKGHNFFYDIHKVAQENPRSWYSAVFKASETGILDQEELDDAKSLMTDDEYEQEFECNFDAAVVGAYYGKQMVKALEEGRICEVPFEPKYQVFSAWDLGYDDLTVVWFFQEINNEIRFIDLMDGHGHDIPYYMDELESNGREEYQYQRHFLPHDAKAKTLGNPHSVIQQMAFDNQMPCQIIRRMSILDSIQATRRLFPRFWFDENKCAIGLEALKLYQQRYDRELKKFRDTPQKDWTNHYADAIKTAVFGHTPSRVSTSGRIFREVGPRTVQSATLDELWKDNELKVMGQKRI